MFKEILRNAFKKSGELLLKTRLRESLAPWKPKNKEIRGGSKLLHTNVYIIVSEKNIFLDCCL